MVKIAKISLLVKKTLDIACFGFAIEAHPFLFAGGNLPRQKFDGDLAFEFRVPGFLPRGITDIIESPKQFRMTLELYILRKSWRFIQRGKDHAHLPREIVGLTVVFKQPK
ncbi:MAG: hypothetical protein ACE5DO_13650, partial [Desulfobacterales bacterium]